MAGGTFELILRTTYPVQASGDTEALSQVQTALAAEFGEFAITEVSVISNPVDPAFYDVSIEWIAAHPDLVLADDVAGVSFQSLGRALLKAKLKQGA